MLKLAILLLAVTLTVSKIATRWMPEEVRKAARIMSWLLGAYVVVMVGLGVLAYMKPN